MNQVNHLIPEQQDIVYAFCVKNKYSYKEYVKSSECIARLAVSHRETELQYMKAEVEGKSSYLQLVEVQRTDKLYNPANGDR